MNENIPEELQLLNEWKERLGLQNWFIMLETNCDETNISEDADGDIQYVESTKCAKIRIINPELRKGALRPFNMEQIIVHELLHCKFALLCKGEDWENNLQLRVLHMIIDDISRALVNAKRMQKDA